MRIDAIRVIAMRLLLVLSATMAFGEGRSPEASDKPCALVPSDGEIDDEYSTVRFLLYVDE
jgi:hypothetical protein